MNKSILLVGKPDNRPTVYTWCSVTYLKETDGLRDAAYGDAYAPGEFSIDGAQVLYIGYLNGYGTCISFRNYVTKFKSIELTRMDTMQKALCTQRSISGTSYYMANGSTVISPSDVGKVFQVRIKYDK